MLNPKVFAFFLTVPVLPNHVLFYIIHLLFQLGIILFIHIVSILCLTYCYLENRISQTTMRSKEFSKVKDFNVYNIDEGVSVSRRGGECIWMSKCMMLIKVKMHYLS